MLLAILIAMLAMTAIVGLRYLAVSGGFAWLTRHRHPGLYSGQAPQIRKEIGWSLASAAIYGIPAGLLAWGWQEHGWTRIYSDVADYPLWWLPLSVLAYLFLHDSWFYWTHRWMHRPRLFRLAHAVHHASRPPTAWAAMSFHPLEALTGAVVIPALVLLVPIHVCALLLVLAVMTVMGVTNHMGWELFPRRLVEGPAGGWLITASHHQRHHRDYRCNYGLYFRFWDRLCGTDRGLGSFDRPAPRGTDRPFPFVALFGRIQALLNRSVRNPARGYERRSGRPGARPLRAAPRRVGSAPVSGAGGARRGAWLDRLHRLR